MVSVDKKVINMGKPHVHADLIKAWADGAEIQFFADGKWFVSNGSPSWSENAQYRITPEETDVDQHGVERGDVWETKSGGICCIHLVEDNYALTLMGPAVNTKKLKTLLFRRGVVDKL